MCCMPVRSRTREIARNSNSMDKPISLNRFVLRHLRFIRGSVKIGRRGIKRHREESGEKILFPGLRSDDKLNPNDRCDDNGTGQSKLKKLPEVEVNFDHGYDDQAMLTYDFYMLLSAAYCSFFLLFLPFG